MLTLVQSYQSYITKYTKRRLKYWKDLWIYMSFLAVNQCKVIRYNHGDLSLWITWRRAKHPGGLLDRMSTQFTITIPSPTHHAIFFIPHLRSYLGHAIFSIVHLRVIFRSCYILHPTKVIFRSCYIFHHTFKGHI